MFKTQNAHSRNQSVFGPATDRHHHLSALNTDAANAALIDDKKSEDFGEIERIADEHFNPGKFTRSGTVRIAKTARGHTSSVILQ